MKKRQALFNWSGGKDSTLALHYILESAELDVKYLFTTVNEAYKRVSMHGVRRELLQQQTKSIGIPLYEVELPESPQMETYEASMRHHLNLMKAEGITESVYGDIFLEDLKLYREKKLAEIGLEAVFPLWKKDTTEIIKEFIGLGYQTVVVCAREGLEHLCGRVIDETFIADLPAGTDPCGENGEFHTFAFNGPIFKQPVGFNLGEKIYKTFPSFAGSDDQPPGYWYIDLIPYTKS